MQQAVAALHRLRSTWLATRTARLNTVRDLLREFGIVIPTGARHVEPTVRGLREDAAAGVPRVLRAVLAEASQEIRELERRIRLVEEQFEAVAEQLVAVKPLRSIPGIGLLTASALVAAAGDVQRFLSGRHFASYLALTPRERSSGQRRQLGGISKRRDSYLRMLLIDGARAMLWRTKRTTAPVPDRLSAWGARTRTHARP